MPQHHPQKLPLCFFRWFCHRDLRDSIEGDLVELYGERVKEIGKRKADVKYITCATDFQAGSYQINQKIIIQWATAQY